MTLYSILLQQYISLSLSLSYELIYILSHVWCSRESRHNSAHVVCAQESHRKARPELYSQRHGMGALSLSHPDVHRVVPVRSQVLQDQRPQLIQTADLPVRH